MQRLLRAGRLKDANRFAGRTKWHKSHITVRNRPISRRAEEPWKSRHQTRVARLFRPYDYGEHPMLVMDDSVHTPKIIPQIEIDVRASGRVASAL
jgi:hypothetical protein